MASFYAGYIGHFDLESRNFQNFGCELTESCVQVSDVNFFQAMLLFSSEIIFMKVPQKDEI